MTIIVEYPSASVSAHMFPLVLTISVRMGTEQLNNIHVNGRCMAAR